MKKIVFAAIMIVVFFSNSTAQGLKFHEPEVLLSEYYFNNVIGYMDDVVYTSTYKGETILLNGYIGEGVDLEFSNVLDLRSPEGKSLAYLNMIVTNKGMIVFGYDYVKKTRVFNIYAQKVSYNGDLEGEPRLVLSPEIIDGTELMKLDIKQSDDKNKFGVYYFVKNPKEGSFSAKIGIFTSSLKELIAVVQPLKMGFVKEGSTDFTFDLFINNQSGYITIVEENIYTATKQYKHRATLDVYDGDGIQIQSIPANFKEIEMYKPIVRNMKGSEDIIVSGFIQHQEYSLENDMGYVGVVAALYSEGDYVNVGGFVQQFDEEVSEKGISKYYKIDEVEISREEELFVYCSSEKGDEVNGEEIIEIGDVLILSFGHEGAKFSTRLKRSMTRVNADKISLPNSSISYPGEQLNSWNYKVAKSQEEAFFLLKWNMGDKPQDRYHTETIQSSLISVQLKDGSLMNAAKRVETNEDPYWSYLKLFYSINNKEFRYR